MSEQFSSAYSSTYDSQYSDKDYEAECDLIERFFKAYEAKKVHTVLDLGCGTGNHAIPLAQRGYSVAGVDRSPGMLEAARSKSSTVEFLQGDVRTCDLGRQFDAALMMFAVLGYQLTNADALAALRTARRHLQPGGLFIFDVWYGPAVLNQRPSERVRVIPTPEGQLVRAVSSSLDSRQDKCTVNYHLWHLSSEHLIAEWKETHEMRYFFPLELELLLESASLKLVHLSPFPEFDGEPDETSWNVIGAAQAI